MEESDGLPDRYKKVKKWSLKKLESHFAEEKSLSIVIGSNIGRLEELQTSYLKQVDGIVEDIENDDEVSAYISGVKEKSKLVELSVLDQQILSTAKDLANERQRLHETERIASYLLNAIKRKSL